MYMVGDVGVFGFDEVCCVLVYVFVDGEVG